VHYVAGFLRRGLGFFLISLLALLVGNLSSTEPVPSQNQRFEFHDDIQALVLSLPDSFRRDQKLVSILAALAQVIPRNFKESRLVLITGCSCISPVEVHL
jgi:hypothetical protein